MERGDTQIPGTLPGLGLGVGFLMQPVLLLGLRLWIKVFQNLDL